MSTTTRIETNIRQARRDDRIAGVLLGQACADALGSGWEFREPSHGKATFRRGTFGHPAGSFTDDTEQACAIALSRSDPGMAAALLLAWFRSHPRDVGATTRRVMGRVSTPRGLAAASKAHARREAAKPKPAGFHEGGANGSLMRCGPTCLPFPGDGAKIAEIARKLSELTHADPYCGDACVLWSLAIDSAVNGLWHDPRTELHEALAFLPAERRQFWAERIAEALKYRPARFGPGNGAAVGAFMCALSAVAHTETYEDCVQLAISAGGDTDTTAAIAGALAGAIYGASAVPPKWRVKVFGLWPGEADSRWLCRLALDAAGAARWAVEDADSHGEAIEPEAAIPLATRARKPGMLL